MSKRKKIIAGLLMVLLVGFILPQKLNMPVVGASTSDYHPDSFWFYPWGHSVTHKGVDIFASKGTPIKSATLGVVIFKGHIRLGGNVVLILGPKWRLHYYAHLDHLETSLFHIVGHSSTIGTVGTSGNAQGKPPHLHYAILTPIPYVWRADHSKQGWKKMFYLNPIKYLAKGSSAENY